jgi:hypothetical protein
MTQPRKYLHQNQITWVVCWSYARYLGRDWLCLGECQD